MTDETDQPQPDSPDRTPKEKPSKEKDFGTRLRNRLNWLKTEPDFAPHVFKDPMLFAGIEAGRGEKPVDVHSFRPHEWRQMEIYKPGGAKSARDVIGLAYHGTPKDPESLFFYEVEPDGSVDGFIKPPNGLLEQIPADQIDYEELAEFLEPTLHPGEIPKKEIPPEARLVVPPPARKEKPPLVRRVLGRFKK